MVRQVLPRSYEVLADGKVYAQNCRHLCKYESKDKVGPAVDPPEVTEETPITTNKEESISPENHQGEGEPQPDNGDKSIINTWQWGISNPQRVGFCKTI